MAFVYASFPSPAIFAFVLFNYEDDVFESRWIIYIALSAALASFPYKY